MKPKTAAKILGRGKSRREIADFFVSTSSRPDLVMEVLIASHRAGALKAPPRPLRGGPRWRAHAIRGGFVFSLFMFLSCAMAPNYLSSRVKGEDVTVNELDVWVVDGVPVENWDRTVEESLDALWSGIGGGPSPELAGSLGGKLLRGDFAGLLLIEPNGNIRVTAKDGSRDAVAQWLAYQNSLQTENQVLGEFLDLVKNSRESKNIYLEIDLEANLLFVKLAEETLYKYPVVTGRGYTPRDSGKKRRFATPRGALSVISKETNPVWRPPAWHWAEIGQDPPGRAVSVRGVLGKYRLNLGDGYGIHGTATGSIGRAGKYSHGCIRMNAKDLEMVFKLCDVGTRIYIY